MEHRIQPAGAHLMKLLYTSVSTSLPNQVVIDIFILTFHISLASYIHHLKKKTEIHILSGSIHKVFQPSDPLTTNI